MKFRIEKKPDFNQWDKLLQANQNILAGNYHFLADLNCKLDVWVYGDYEILIPLATQKKYWLTKAIQPVGIQQTAFLSFIDIHSDVKKNIWETWQKHYSFFEIQCPIPWAPSDFQTRNNFILPLQTDYLTLKKNFTKGRKYEISHFSEQLIATQILSSQVFEFWKQHKHYGDTLLENQVFQLLQALEKNKAIACVGVEKNAELIGCVVLSLDQKRIYNLLSVSSAIGKEFQAQSFAINHVIQKYAGEDKILDFEGSDIPGVASFFKSWGSISVPYAKVYHASKSIQWLKSIKKIKRQK